MGALAIILRLGCRNLWRNPRRSLITISAVACGYALLIGLIGLMEGLSEQLLRNGTLLRLGHFQVHDRSYLPDRNLNDTLGGQQGVDLGALLSELRGQPGVVQVSARVIGYGLLSTGEYSSGAEILGVDPGAEERVTVLLRGLEPGGRIPEADLRGLLLGDTLAREIHARPGDEVAVVAQAADGTLGNDLFVVRGILHTGLSHLDRSLAVTHLVDLQQLLSLTPGRVHEVAGISGDPLASRRVSEQLNQSGRLPPGGEARSWQELAPQLREYLSLGRGLNAFMVFLVSLFAAFGMLNTTMMAVFERTHEIGMLGSLGMRPTHILLSIVVETALLSLIGIAAGFGLGAALMYYLTRWGWDLSAWVGEVAIGGARMDPVLKGAWVWDQVALAAVGLGAVMLIAALFPARRVAWMEPVDALAAPTED